MQSNVGARPSWLQLCYDLVWVGVTLGHSYLQASCFAMGWPWALLTALWALGAMGATALRIGAFNIQSFGDSKVSDPDCGSVIAQVRPSGVAEDWDEGNGGGELEVGRKMGLEARLWAIRLIGTVYLWVLL